MNKAEQGDGGAKRDGGTTHGGRINPSIGGQLGADQGGIEEAKRDGRRPEDDQDESAEEEDRPGYPERAHDLRRRSG
jgi:hypothetical protein